MKESDFNDLQINVTREIRELIKDKVKKTDDEYNLTENEWAELVINIGYNLAVNSFLTSIVGLSKDDKIILFDAAKEKFINHIRDSIEESKNDVINHESKKNNIAHSH